MRRCMAVGRAWWVLARASRAPPALWMLPALSATGPSCWIARIEQKGRGEGDLPRGRRRGSRHHGTGQTDVVGISEADAGHRVMMVARKGRARTAGVVREDCPTFEFVPRAVPSRERVSRSW